jgi:hypothetical protein
MFRFDPIEYCVLENVGTVELRCTVDRGSLAVPTEVTINYTVGWGDLPFHCLARGQFCFKTIPDTAVEYEDYIPTQGVLTFGAEETAKFIEIGIVDNEEYEEDEQFFVIGRVYANSY